MANLCNNNNTKLHYQHKVRKFNYYFNPTEANFLYQGGQSFSHKNEL